MKLRLERLVSNMERVVFIETESIRRIDDLGRVVIPKSVREKVGIEVGDPLVICYNGKGIFIKKYDDREERFNNAVDVVCSECHFNEETCDICPVAKIYKKVNEE